MIIIDGLIDDPIAELGHLTSFSYSNTPNIDEIFAGGRQRFLNACPEGYNPESMYCILNLLGVDTKHFPNSRASLELLASGQQLKDDEVVLRCNLIEVENGKLKSFNGGSLTYREMAEMARGVNPISENLKFYHLSGYRNLIVMKKNQFRTLDCVTYPPHENLREDVDGLLTDVLSSSNLLSAFVANNQIEIKDPEHGVKTYMFYPWGIALSSKLPSFKDLYGINGAAICGAEIVKGIALALGMFVPEVAGLTADVDTDLTAKAKTAVSLLKEFDFVLVHINGTDEASHRCDVQEKIRFIERIDQEFFGCLRNRLDESTQLIVCADHGTSPVTGKHTDHKVPCLVNAGFCFESFNDRNETIDSKRSENLEVGASNILKAYLNPDYLLDKQATAEDHLETEVHVNG